MQSFACLPKVNENTPLMSYFFLILYQLLTSPLPKIANFCTKYFIQQDLHYEGGIKQLYHGLSACTGDNSLAKARALSPGTGEKNRGVTNTYHPNSIHASFFNHDNLCQILRCYYVA